MKKKYYILYKTTNLINNKIYVGSHASNSLEDTYLGSGNSLKKDIKRYGKENFKKEILKVFETLEEVLKEEAKIVNKDFVNREDTYNVLQGGGHNSYPSEEQVKKAGKTTYEKKKGAFTPSNQLKAKEGFLKYTKTEKFKKQHSKMVELAKSIESSEKRKKTFEKNGHQKGKKNSQYGTYWITNGKENKKWKSSYGDIPENWYKGRVTKTGT
jgi:hypothetical protein